MNKKIAVTPAEASKLMADGYDIECYLILPPAKNYHAQRNRSGLPHIPNSANLALSTQPKRVPVKGAIAETWKRVKKEVFNDSLTKLITRRRLEDWCEKNGGTRNNVSQFIHAYKCLRVIEDGVKKLPAKK
jgi:hypothetical protein